MIRSSVAAFAMGLGYALMALQAPLLIACRGGLDSVCHCASDCRAGLVCELEDMNALGAEMCFSSGINGRCVESQAGDTDDNDSQIVPDFPLYPPEDLPSRRDFGSGSESNSLSGTSTGVTDTTVTDTTDSNSGSSSTSSTGSSSTTDTTDTTDTTGTTTSSSSSSSSSTGDSAASSSSSTT